MDKQYFCPFLHGKIIYIFLELRVSAYNFALPHFFIFDLIHGFIGCINQKDPSPQ